MLVIPSPISHVAKASTCSSSFATSSFTTSSSTTTPGGCSGGMVAGKRAGGGGPLGGSKSSCVSATAGQSSAVGNAQRDLIKHQTETMRSVVVRILPNSLFSISLVQINM